MTIEGTSQAGKNNWVLVTMVNDNKLSDLIMISTTNLDPFARIPTNTLCRFKGKEITYVVQEITDPNTGWPMQQASSGRHFDFKVTKVFAPEGVKIREEK